jgi:hypothetical protein
MKQEFNHVSVVIQGPVQTYQGRDQVEGITKKCLLSIRKHLPGATIILSTWQGQDLSGLDYDQLVLSEDPGQNNDGYCPVNYYRQIMSTKAGLDCVTTSYAIKLRSDNYLTGNQFVQIQQSFPKNSDKDKIFKEKVVINSNLFRRTSNGHRVIFSVSDFFYYGLTADLQLIWDQPPFTEQLFSDQLLAKSGQRSKAFKALEAEQVYCQIWLKRLTQEVPSLIHRYDVSKQDLKFWDRFLANNIIIGDPETMGLGLRAASTRNFKRANEYSHLDWLKLYRKHCDKQQVIPFSLAQLSLSCRRFFKLPISRLYTKIKRRNKLA